MSVLYLCYQSLLDPLTQTQVVAYLEGLTDEAGTIVLLTFEPSKIPPDVVRDWEQRLSERGIIWKRMRYHKRPTLPATSWDILSGIVTGRRLIKKYKVGLVHARSHVPAVMGAALKQMTGVRLLFDVRGLLAEEYVDAGVWKEGGWLFRHTKQAEQKLVHCADGLVVLTEQAKQALQTWYPRETARKPLMVIPCCADLRDCPARGVSNADQEQAQIRRLVYAGKLGGWNPTQDMIDFLFVAARVIPNLQCQVWTQSDLQEFSSTLQQAGLSDRVTVSRAAPAELAQHLTDSDAGLAFVRRRRSSQACSPTKIGEYLAAGLPVVSFTGVGDVDNLLSGCESPDGRPVGVLVEESSVAAFERACGELMELWDDPETPSRCRAVARRVFDLQEVGWRRYREVYSKLLRPQSCAVSKGSRTRPMGGEASVAIKSEYVEQGGSHIVRPSKPLG